jgi:hypothetical protein
MNREYNHVVSQTLDWIAIILALAALIAAIVAIQSSNNATHKLDAQDAKINALSKEVKLLNRPATPGGGVGPNTGTQSVVPTGSGQ